MFEAVTLRAGTQDIIIKAAAAGRLPPCGRTGDKIKKSADGSDLNLALEAPRTSWAGWESTNPRWSARGFPSGMVETPESWSRST